MLDLMNGISMTSSRPYLLRAIYDWIVDNGLTPYLLVDATADKVEVPQQYVNNGKIILNISPAAVQNIHLGDDEVSFNARFDGQPMSCLAPIAATLAIYAKENGRGMVFTDDDMPTDPEGRKTKAPDKSKSGKSEVKKKSGQPTLRVVK
jgi:stringent starvation protein B